MGRFSIAGLASFIPILAGNLGFGQSLGTMAAMFGGITAISLWNSSISISRGVTLFFAVFLAGVMINGYFYDVPGIALWLVVCSPAFLWAANLSRFSELAPWKLVVLRCTLCAIPLLVALVFAFQNSIHKEEILQFIGI